MAGLKGKSGPPGNMNASKHGLAAIQKRREEAIHTENERIRQQKIRGTDGHHSSGMRKSALLESYAMSIETSGKLIAD